MKHIKKITLLCLALCAVNSWAVMTWDGNSRDNNLGSFTTFDGDSRFIQVGRADRCSGGCNAVLYSLTPTGGRAGPNVIEITASAASAQTAPISIGGGPDNIRNVNCTIVLEHDLTIDAKNYPGTVISVCPTCTLNIEGPGKLIIKHNAYTVSENTAVSIGGMNGNNGTNASGWRSDDYGGHANDNATPGTDGGRFGVINIISGSVDVKTIAGGKGGNGGNGGDGKKRGTERSGGDGSPGKNGGHGGGYYGNSGYLNVYGGNLKVYYIRGGNGGDGGNGGRFGDEDLPRDYIHDGRKGLPGMGGYGGYGCIVRIYGGNVHFTVVLLGGMGGINGIINQDWSDLGKCSQTEPKACSDGNFSKCDANDIVFCSSLNTQFNEKCRNCFTQGGDFNDRQRVEASRGSIYIYGGSVDYPASGSPQPRRGSSGPVLYKNTLTLRDTATHENTAGQLVTGGSVDGTAFRNHGVATPATVDAAKYGINDMHTDVNGKLYLWLPEYNNANARVSVELGGIECAPYSQTYPRPPSTQSKDLYTSHPAKKIHYFRKDYPANSPAPSPATGYAYCGGTNVYSGYTCAGGYTFVGWSEGSSQSSPPVRYAGYPISLSSYNAENLYACCEPTRYDVILAKNALTGGVTDEGTQRVSVYFNAAMPAGHTPPVRTGYHFEGYTQNAGANNYTAPKKYYNASMQSAHVFDIPSPNPATIYAQWRPVTYKVKYHINTPASVTGALPAAHLHTYDAPVFSINNYIGGVDPLVRAGYTMLGWSQDSAALRPDFNGTTTFGAGKTDHVGNLSCVQDTTLHFYVVWQPNKYLITLNKRGGSAGNSSVLATYDSLMPAAIAPTRTGYIFAGYYEDTLALGKCYYNRLMSRSFVWDKPRPDTLYAIWRSENMSVTLDKMGGTGGDDEIVSAIYGNSMPPDYTAPAKEGYRFGGYWSLPLEGEQYYNGSMQSARTWDAVGDRLFARWLPDTFKVILNLNYSGAPTPDTLRAIYGQTTPLNRPPAHDGYRFRFWKYTAPAGAHLYYDAYTCTFTHDIILEAQWVTGGYEVNFKTNYYEPNGTEMTKFPIVVIQNEAIGLMPDIVPRPLYGYHYVGWFYPDTASLSRQYTEDDLYDIGTDALFHARWQPNRRTLHLSAEGGKAGGQDTMDVTVYYGREVGYLLTPLRAGHSFAGWHSSPQGVINGGWGAASAAWTRTDLYLWDYDRTIYAHWTPRVDTISFDPRGGDPVPPIGVMYSDTIGELPLPVRTGYTFAGWYAAAPPHTHITADSIYRTDGHSILFARWERRVCTARFVASCSPDAIVLRLYGETLPRPADPQLTDRAGQQLSFEGWYLSGAHGERWDFFHDTITENITLTARWTRTHPVIDSLPRASLVYGASLGEILLTEGYWSNNNQDVINGYFAFTSPNIRPEFADSGVTKYEIGFFPYDSIYYAPAFDSIVVQVHRRELIITARSAALVLGADTVLRAPGGWSDIPSFLAGRWDAQGLTSWDAPYLNQILEYPIYVTLARTQYTAAGFYRDEVLAGGPAYTSNYRITYRAGNLYVSRLTFLPPDTIVFGNHLPLNAVHETQAQYTGSLKYYSVSPSVMSVTYSAQDGWQARAARTGITDVCVYFEGRTGVNPPAPPDTACATIRVVPRRGVEIIVQNERRAYALPLPSHYNFIIQGLHNSAEYDTILNAGISVNVLNAPSDTPPAGDYILEPCCVSHPNYADFVYKKGKLSIFQCGTRLQELDFDSLPPVFYSAKEISVWANARTCAERCRRRVEYESSNPFVAEKARDTLLYEPFIEDGDTLWIDTLWGAVVQIRKTGVTRITAYNADCDNYLAVYGVRPLLVMKDTQSVILPLPAIIDSGERTLLRGSATSGLPLTYYITGEDSASVAIIRHDSLISIGAGRITVRAVQKGSDIYEAAWTERSVWVRPPHSGGLKDLIAYYGQLTPITDHVTRGGFDPAVNEYNYTLPCHTDTLTLVYDTRNSVLINNEQGGEKFVVEASSKYTQIEIQINSASVPSVCPPPFDLLDSVACYTLNVRRPLPKEYIYYSPAKFPNRMEVVNHSGALGGRQFSRYQWFEDGEELPDETKGVLYRAGGFNIGSIYSARGFYDESTVYGSDSVDICGQRAVIVQSGLEVFPNPAWSVIVVRHPSLGKTGAPIEIYTMSGSKIKTVDVSSANLDAEEHSVMVDVSGPDFPPGAYVVRFMDASVTITIMP